MIATVRLSRRSNDAYSDLSAVSQRFYSRVKWSCSSTDAAGNLAFECTLSLETLHYKGSISTTIAMRGVCGEAQNVLREERDASSFKSRFQSQRRWKVQKRWLWGGLTTLTALYRWDRTAFSRRWSGSAPRRMPLESACSYARVRLLYLIIKQEMKTRGKGSTRACNIIGD